MTMSNPAEADHRPALIVPALGRLYSGLSETTETILRVVAGGVLVTHGYDKILDPLGTVAMVEKFGLAPASFWSPLLSVTEFFGGLFVAAGLLTRPAALAASAALGATVYFNWVLQGQGWSGAEKFVIWTAIMLYFTVRGGNGQSVDAKIGRYF
jgi:putative oxidoreductase